MIIAHKKLVGQRVTLENQIHGLAIVFGVRLPRGLSRAFVEQALRASEGIDGLSGAMRGLIEARSAVLSAVASIDACRRPMTIPGGGYLTALAFTAAVDDAARFPHTQDPQRTLPIVSSLANDIILDTGPKTRRTPRPVSRLWV